MEEIAQIQETKQEQTSHYEATLLIGHSSPKKGEIYTII